MMGMNDRGLPYVRPPLPLPRSSPSPCKLSTWSARAAQGGSAFFDREHKAPAKAYQKVQLENATMPAARIEECNHAAYAASPQDSCILCSPIGLGTGNANLFKSASIFNRVEAHTFRLRKAPLFPLPETKDKEKGQCDGNSQADYNARAGARARARAGARAGAEPRTRARARAEPRTRDSARASARA
eukprot:scaffold229053_cov32-Tisochrysis_lutea.AAC.4